MLRLPRRIWLQLAILAAVTVIVYAGAMVVTLVFVIMLAQQSGATVYAQRSRQPEDGASHALYFGGVFRFHRDKSFRDHNSEEQRILRLTDNNNVGTNQTTIVSGLPTAGQNHDGGSIGFGFSTGTVILSLPGSSAFGGGSFC